MLTIPEKLVELKLQVPLRKRGCVRLPEGGGGGGDCVHQGAEPGKSI